MARGARDGEDRAMPSLLIRCSPHDELSHDAFRTWVRERCAQLDAVADLRTARLSETAWVLHVELDEPPGANGEHDVSDLLGDLRLLGLDPLLYRPGSVRARPSGAPLRR